MDEADIHKTAFHAGSSGLYEFTHMPFRLSNAGASFFHLMEMCLGDQQYLTLLFYLNDICIFGSSIDEMLDRIAMVLQHLKDFNLKIKPKKLFFFQSNILFLGPYALQRWDSTKPWKGEQGKELANSKDSEGSSFVPWISFILLKVYTQIHEMG